MKRSRLALAVLLSAVLLATIASPASAYVVRRPRLTTTGWYTIYQTFTHTSAGDGCSDFPGWSYKVAMSAHIYVGTTTFKVQTVTVKYTVTSGRMGRSVPDLRTGQQHEMAIHRPRPSGRPALRRTVEDVFLHSVEDRREGRSLSGCRPAERFLLRVSGGQWRRRVPGHRHLGPLEVR